MAFWFAAIGLVLLGLTSLSSLVMPFVMRQRHGWRCDKCRPKVACVECGEAAPDFNLGDLQPHLKFPRGARDEERVK